MIVGIGSVWRHADDRAAVPRRHGGTAETPGLDQAAIAPLIAHRRLKEIPAVAGQALCLRRAHRGDGRRAQRCQRQANAQKGFHHATLQSRLPKGLAALLGPRQKPRWHELIIEALRRLLKAWSPQAKPLQAWSLFGGHGLVQDRPRGIVGTPHRKRVVRRIVDRRIGDHFRRHQDLCDLLRIQLRLTLGVGFEIRLGIRFGRAFGIERVFDGQHTGEDRSVGVNVLDFAGVDLLIPVEGAAPDDFDFALDKPQVALLRP
jgi:hypothetical protein